MKKTIKMKIYYLKILLFALCLNINAQEEKSVLLEEVKRQAMLIDSLKKKNDSIVKAKDKYQVDSNLKLKGLRDSISVLKSRLQDKDRQLTNLKINSQKEIKLSKNEGKEEILSSIIKTFKNQSFDSLIESCTSESIDVVLPLLNNEPNIKKLLLDLKRYFESEKLLKHKFDPVITKNNLVILNDIKRESEFLNKLIRDLSQYKNYNEGLKTVLIQIRELDIGMPTNGVESLKQRKYNKISEYIFNYDYNLYDYPYLSNILLELTKRKFPNPDADIQDLINQLN